MFRKIIKNCPPLLFIVRLFRTGFMTGQDVMLQLPQYIPVADGRGQLRSLSHMTILAARQTDPLLAELADNYRISKIEPLAIERFCASESKNKSAKQLAELFLKHGSDKSSSHDYHLLYGPLLDGRSDQALDLLEIGLGTNNTNIMANMGANGRPGASLRAFRDFLPKSRIFGADIDREILFREDRIETFPVDQLDPESFDELARNLEHRKFDLIIDDGLHASNANLQTLLFGLKHLKEGGCMVVEDISNQSMPIWKIASVILSERYQSHIVRARGGNMFVVAKPEVELLPPGS